MVRRNGRKWLNRFLGSRVLTLTTVLILCVGWMLLACFLLWQVKVKEEFSCLGKLSFSLEPGASAIGGSKQLRVTVLQGPSPNSLRSLLPGDEVHLALEEQRGQTIGLRAQLVALEGDNGHSTLVLRPAKEAIERGLEGYGADRAEPVRFSLGLRSRRLLWVAFERSPLPK